MQWHNSTLIVVKTLKQSIVTIKSGNPVRFCHRGIVERRIDEVHQSIVRLWLSHDRLADMDDLCCVSTETVNPKNLQSFSMKQDLQHSCCLAGDLCTGDALEMSVTDFVGNQGVGQFSFRFSNRTDFLTGVNSCRNIQGRRRATRFTAS